MGKNASPFLPLLKKEVGRNAFRKRNSNIFPAKNARGRMGEGWSNPRPSLEGRRVRKLRGFGKGEVVAGIIVPHRKRKRRGRMTELKEKGCTSFNSQGESIREKPLAGGVWGKGESTRQSKR